MGRVPHNGRKYFLLSVSLSQLNIFLFVSLSQSPIQVNVPRTSILVGSRGSASAEDINTLVEGVMEQNLLGIMVWYCSVQNGFQYEVDWDCSGR